MRYSSGVLWRHADWEDFRRECPDGDEALQRALFERLDADLDWLEARGARVTARRDREPPHRGPPLRPGLDRRRAGRRARVLRAAATRCPDGAPVVLATGGFAASRDAAARARHAGGRRAAAARPAARAPATGCGSGSAAGARTSAGLGEIYGRAMPAAPLAPERWITDAQLYARHATVTDEAGERYEARTWSEIDVVQWLARRPGARGWLVVAPDKLGERDARTGPSPSRWRAPRRRAPRSAARAPATVSVHVAAAVTTTLGGLAVGRARPRRRRRVGGGRRRGRDRRGRLRERAGRRARDGRGSPRRRRCGAA